MEFLAVQHSSASSLLRDYPLSPRQPKGPPWTTRFQDHAISAARLHVLCHGVRWGRPLGRLDRGGPAAAECWEASSGGPGGIRVLGHLHLGGLGVGRPQPAPVDFPGTAVVVHLLILSYS